jgi:hypothetical protein
MSGIIDKLTHRHHKDTATPVATTTTAAPISSQTYSETTTLQQPIQHATTHVAAPIVQETVRNDRVVEVQPVVHREVDQNVVHHIEKHYHEAAPSMAGVVERQAVVQQQVHTNVVNEIQPVIHRERVVPVVERSEQHLTQHIVQPTIHTHEVVYERGPYIQQQGQTFNQNIYQGINLPYMGAANHPTYGYPRLSRDQKIQRFELKAAEWEKRGNMAKAQKNRNKALQYRQMSQPGYVRPVRPQNYYTDRANLFDQKALRYQQMGMAPQAQRYQGRSQRIRAKHNIPLGQNLGQQGLQGQNLGFQQQGLQGQTLGLQKYQGLNLPYTGASNHPTYGYPRLSRDQKIQRFELKAAEWEKRGNMAKAQKNRNKALQYRQMSQPGYVRPVRPQNYYTDRASLFDQKALRYQQMGMAPQAQRYQGRSQRIRAKHNIPLGQQQGLQGQNLGFQQQGLQGQSLPQQALQQGEKFLQQQQLQQQQQHAR